MVAFMPQYANCAINAIELARISLVWLISTHLLFLKLIVFNIYKGLCLVAYDGSSYRSNSARWH